ncbi:MAG: glycosyltransferase [Actinomycetaceae bacterium]|nr:glycosyltransferase [Actinomycetaceae bacterium]
MARIQNVLPVLITKADSPYCERTLRSLFSQSALPERLIIGVLGADASPIRRLCEKLDPPTSCDIRLAGDASTFFEAVNCVIRNRDGGADGSEEWLWLLHEDSAPEVHCLESVLHSATSYEGACTVGIVGTKQVDWDNPRQLLEVGIRATRSARRIPDIASHEYDQGQYDKRQEVLAVGSAGMLLRQSALKEIGGFGQGLGPFGDGLELSRRMRAGGYEVIVCPQAKVRHAQHSLGEKAHDSFGERRKAQIFNALVGAPSALFPFLFLFYLLLAPARALARLAMGKVRLAGAELYGAFALLGSFGAVSQARKRLALASNDGNQHSAYEDAPRAIRAAQRAHRSANKDASVMEYLPDPLTEQALRERHHLARTYGWAILVVTGLATLLAHLPHFSIQATGGALLPDTSSFSEGMRTAASAWLASADGYASGSDVFWGFLTPLSLATSQLGVTATWIVFLSVIAAAFSAYIAASDINVSPLKRAIGALIWAFAPPLLDSVNAGQVAGVLVHIVAPLAVMAYLRAWKGSASALAASALLFAFLASASPMLLVISLLAAIAGFIRHPQSRARWLALPLPALIMLAPTLFALARLSFAPNAGTAALSAPWRFLFSTPGAAIDTHSSPLSLLSFSPLNWGALNQFDVSNLSVLVQIIPIAALLVVAIMALVRPSRYIPIRLGWLFIGAGWAWALVASSMPVGIVTNPGEYTITRGWAGIALSFAFLGLWIVVLNMTGSAADETANVGTDEDVEGDGSATKAKKFSFTRAMSRIGLNGVSLVCALAALIYGGLWAANSFTGSGTLLKPATAQAPALALADEKSDNHSRVLALSANENGIQAQLWRGDGLQLHETSMLVALLQADAVASGDTSPQREPYGARANKDLAEALASLSSDSQSVPQTLTEHGVSVVLVPQEANDSASRTLVGRLNSVRGLEYITTNETGTFWRVRTDDGVSASPARLRLVAGEGENATRVALPSGVFGAQVDMSSVLDQFNGDGQRSDDTSAKQTGTAKPEKRSAAASGETSQKTDKKTEHNGRLVLAERADSRWHAQLVSPSGTQELTPSGESWQQEWDIPLDVEDADIVVYYGSPLQRLWPYVQFAAIALSILGVLALPRRKRVRYE